jgi:CRISPR-associated protein Cmr4
MKTMMLGLLAETSIHPGAGSSAGFIDLPVAREAATDYPVIVGSSVKGALLDMARQPEHQIDDPTIDQIFGKPDGAGTLLVSDLRLLMLPVRSLTSQYKWVTCPHLIERYVRDARRASSAADGPFDFSRLIDGNYLGKNEGSLFLEERQFHYAGDLPKGICELIGPLIHHIETRTRLPHQLVAISDLDFAWFARFGLAVNARNKLKDETKTSINLWYEETIPPDSLFYCLLAERSAKAIDTVVSMFVKRSYIQVGGNETVGQGWFSVALPEVQGGDQ